MLMMINASRADTIELPDTSRGSIVFCHGLAAAVSVSGDVVVGGCRRWCRGRMDVVVGGWLSEVWLSEVGRRGCGRRGCGGRGCGGRGCGGRW